MKLILDSKKLENCHSYAKNIALDVFFDIQDYSTVSIERTVARILGVKGAKHNVPYPNILIDYLIETNQLEDGVLIWLANAMLSTNYTPLEITKAISDKKDMEIKKWPRENIDKLIYQFVGDFKSTISNILQTRNTLVEKLGMSPPPLAYVLTATGNVYEDCIQGRAVVKSGGDIIAVLRSTAQSLLDYVPYGLTTEGYGGTYATQENFTLMRDKMDEAGEEFGRYIQVSNFCSGLCMPEMAIMGGLERLDNMANDALYGIIYRDINMKRTLIDQKISRFINGLFDITINTGEDNYLRTADAVSKAYTVTVSNFINYYLAVNSGLKNHQIALGHAMEINPNIENSFLLELAGAQLLRDLFPFCKTKYMPPTRHMNGNLLRTHSCDTLFNLIASLTNQDIETVGIPTEGIHTPHIADRVIGTQNAKYVFNATRQLKNCLDINNNELIQTRANTILDEAEKQLKIIESESLFEAIEKGAFGDTSRKSSEGKGLEGIFRKSEKYIDIFTMM
jgi:beta-lysine 5,6-aminomutase alpha subunit